MKNDFRFYIVDAVCGHVGNSKYVIKSFVIEAKNAKEAAAIGRGIPRVKHHYKYAIQSVREVSFEEYLIQRLKNEFDPYLNVSNRSEQRRFCNDLEIHQLEDLGGINLYKRNSKVGPKKYINNYVMDKTELEEYRYVS